MTETHIVVGCGGTGSYLVPALSRVLLNVDHRLILMDADTIEPRNLDRQLFGPGDVGKNKAEALAEKLQSDRVKALPRYFYASDAELVKYVSPTIWSCADNHPTRAEALHFADTTLGTAVIMGNEYTDADAHYYFWTMRGTEADPRVKHPEILSDKSGDPRSPCTGEAQENRPQLAISNMLSAAMGLHLWWFHTRDAKNISRALLRKHLPVGHYSNRSTIRTQTV